MYFASFRIPFTSETQHLKTMSSTRYTKMPSLDEESVSSSDTLLEKQASAEALVEYFKEEHLVRKKHWTDRLPGRRTIFAHFIIFACYLAVYAITLDQMAKRYEHGPDYTFCQLSTHGPLLIAFN